MEIQPEVIEELKKAAETKFWGDIRLTYQLGEVITLRVESNRKLKPPYRPNKEQTHGKPSYNPQ